MHLLRKQAMDRATWTCGLLVAAMSASVLAIGNLGTPTAELEKGQWSIGGDYAYYGHE
jgi:hypothetical protein